tara:strand:- start:386 stop:499 length:114 start_codon:yes stop_codon:yes gene_type:complete
MSKPGASSACPHELIDQDELEQQWLSVSLDELDVRRV